MTILFVTSIAVIQGKMHVDWHVYKFVELHSLAAAF